MNHWRTSRIASGGQPRSGSPHGADTHADSSILFSTYAPLPRSELTQAMLDILTVCVWMLFGLLGAAVVGGPVIVVMWMLFFS